MILEVPIEEWQIERARKQTDLMPKELKNSIRHGKGTFVGKKGEYEDSNNFTFKCDCYNLSYSELEMKINGS